MHNLKHLKTGTNLGRSVTLGEILYVALTEANNDSFPDVGLERDSTFPSKPSSPLPSEAGVNRA